MWDDVNGNGVRDATPTAEAGSSGWTVFVDTNGNQVADPAEPQAITTADGTYTITGVTPGSVTIVVRPRSGWHATFPISGTRSLTLKNGENVTNVVFGEQQVRDSALSGTVFADSNKDGVRNIDEKGLNGIVVYLDTNGNAAYDVSEPTTTTSEDLFFTPAVDEAGTYSFTHLASGTYQVRQVIPAVLSATPASELVHSATVGATQTLAGVDFADVYRRNEIRGVKFDDADRDGIRDAGEAGIAGATIFIDLNRNDTLDLGERETITLGDGSYEFLDLSPGAYVVREVLEPGHSRTTPDTIGGILWPAGISNSAVGNVTPLSITKSLSDGEHFSQSITITLPGSGGLTNLVDVFLLFDDTGSFTYNSPIVRGAFPTIMADLQSSLPGVDLGFGVGRFEEYANFAWEYAAGRPFVLNQPIVASSTVGYQAAIQAALNRTAPGYGGDGPETDIEALYQLVTGLGFDGNNNGTVTDSGAAGLSSTQLTPGASGDVPSFASFTVDTASGALAPAGTIGGGGFRAGALPVILLATDVGFAYQPKGETSITGIDGVTLPISALTQTSRASTPFGSGAGIQETITGLNALGALVIGLGTNPVASTDPRLGLESLAKLTGATNQTLSTIANGTADPIAPGDPFYFQISSGFASSVSAGVTKAIQNAVTNVAVNISVQASDPRVRIINHTGTLSHIGSGQTASFDIEFVGDGVPHRFDLQFVREGTNVVLGSIPVVLGTPVPGDGYHFDDLDEGEIEWEDHFGDTAESGVTPNVAPSFVAGTDQFAVEDNGLQTVAAWATSITPGPASEASQTVDFIVTNSNPSLFSVAPSISANGTLTFTSAPDANGTATIAVALHDNGGTANGGQDTSAAKSFLITITAVNDTPVASNDSYSVDQDTTLSIAAAGVLSNDTDADLNPLSAIRVVTTIHGTVTLGTNGAFTYTPDAGFVGTDSFTYVANDGTVDSNIATVTITVNAVNHAPVAFDDSYSVDQDATLSIAAAGVLSNDTDSDLNPLSAIRVVTTTHGTAMLGTNGSLTYTPNAGFVGTDSFTYVANDGTVDSNIATVTITVKAVNHAPVAFDDSYSVDQDTMLSIAAAGVLSNDTDADLNPLSAIRVVTTTHGTATLGTNGSLTYTPNAGFVGTDSFTYVANDGTVDSNIATVTITVNAVNHAPVAFDDSYSVDQDTTLSIAAAGVLSNDTDADLNPLSAIRVVTTIHGTVTLGTNGAFTYTPNAEFVGTDSFTYVANDGTVDSNIATVTITVNAVNHAPVAFDDSYSVDQDTTLSIAAAGVLNNDTDADSNPLSAIRVVTTTHGTVTLGANGAFTYTPDAGFVGADSFTYVANDGTVDSNIATVTITINGTMEPGTPEFVVVDQSRRRTYQYDVSGIAVENSRLNNENETPRGIATGSDGSKMWVVDSKGEVFVYDNHNQLIGSWELEDIDKPEGITVNGNDLWIVDREEDQVHFFRNGALRLSGHAEPTSSFRLDRANREPMDIVTNGSHIWVVNDTSTVDRVFRYTVDGSLDGSWQIDTRNTKPTGLTVDPNNVNDIWIVDSNSDSVFKYGNAATRTSDQQSSIHVFALDPTNKNPQGIAIRPNLLTSELSYSPFLIGSLLNLRTPGPTGTFGTPPTHVEGSVIKEESQPMGLLPLSESKASMSVRNDSAITELSSDLARRNDLAVAELDFDEEILSSLCVDFKRAAGRSIR